MHIVFTGGGTGGHVVPNLALIDALTATEPAPRISYIGSHSGPEKDLVLRAGIKFHGIASGKLRRYFDWQNFVDPFKVLLGLAQAWRLLGRLKPDRVFSKGGFVALPVVLAAWVRRIPVIIHESDSIPGLTTKLCAPFAQKILLGFEVRGLKKSKCEVVGNPVRAELFKGSEKRGLKWTGFSGKRPVLLVMGGSSGSMELNQRYIKERDEITQHYDVVHVFGKGKGHASMGPHFRAVPYLHEELCDVYSITDVVMSRAGANSLAEFEALGIPALLFPLGVEVSRGDQIENARQLAKRSPAYAVAKKGPLLPQLKKLKPAKKSPHSAIKKILTHLQ